MIRTKIIATVGPASDSLEVVGQLIDAGADVFRLNFSHGTLEEHGRTLERIRAAARERGAIVAVMGDLCGPKIRVDEVADGAFEIASGDRIDVVSEHVVGNAERISTNRPELAHEVAVGHRVLIDDGLIRLRVEEALPDRLRCVCQDGGAIRTRKGLNLPDSDLAMSALTDKDKRDLAWAMEHGLDYVALSFVRRAEDLAKLRGLMRWDEASCPVVAKIETPQAIEHLDGIIEAADVVLVARGDLGVEMDLARVPLLQKEITAKCQKAGKPVIIATQMLQSMVEHPTATRAEVSDVANAILDSADCVMLSAETSVGAYPVASVRMLDRIAEQTEAYLSDSGAFAQMDADATMNPMMTAVVHGANLLARELNAKLLAVWSETGYTVRLLSKCRPNRPVIGLSPDERVCRRMAMYYGVEPACIPRPTQLGPMLQAIDEVLLKHEWAARDDLIVVVAGTRLEAAGATSTLLVHLLGDEGKDPLQFA
ncbi:MAG: pyruvate kinase [Phycisphaerae bacterium]|nr:pyruvate kinase [Phycisphaerae bacterium]